MSGRIGAIERIRVLATIEAITKIRAITRIAPTGWKDAVLRMGFCVQGVPAWRITGSLQTDRPAMG
jgi:hypothetical protein